MIFSIPLKDLLSNSIVYYDFTPRIIYLVPMYNQLPDAVFERSTLQVSSSKPGLTIGNLQPGFPGFPVTPGEQHYRKYRECFEFLSAAIYCTNRPLRSIGASPSSGSICAGTFNWRRQQIQLLKCSEIWGSHGAEYEDGCLLGCSAV
jgi:hypothetical protein